MKPLGQNLKQFVSLWLVVLLSAMVALTFADVLGGGSLIRPCLGPMI
jgi:hypothetical protein